MKSRPATWLTCLLLGVTAAIPVEGAAKAAAVRVASEPHAADMDVQELTNFMNQFMASGLGRFHSPGASVVVVKDGAVILEKGYGYANLKQQSRFTPSTRFRAKSVSKTFTATAVMQLMEDGQVALDVPVTSYLRGFALPGGNDPPITLAQLLTQTSGIGDRAVGTMTSDRTDASNLRRYLQADMPPRIAEPGKVFSYTDHGISLAGLTVEEVSRLPFGRYMQERILGPLGMTQSAFDPPLEGQPDIAVGYQYVSGSYRPAPVGYFYVAPAVSLVTTGADMGRFLVGMLGGSADTPPILLPETVRLMESKHFALQPDGPGVAYGLYEWPEIGERVLVHGGLGHGFSNLLVLLPDRRVGFFVDTNSDEPELRYALLRAFMDRFYPGRSTAPRPIAERDLERFAGVYSDYRYEGRIEALKELFDQGAISVNGGRTLSVSWVPGRWIEVEPLIFQDLDDPNQRMSFQTDASGRVTQAYGPHDDGYRKVPWYRSLLAYAVGVLLFALLFLSAPITWLGSALWQRRRKPTEPRLAKAAKSLATLMSVLNLVFLVGIPVSLLPYAGLNGTQLDFGPPATIQALFAVPLATTALAVILAAGVVIVLWEKTWSRLGRIHLTAIATGGLLFPGFLSFWNLLGLVG